MNSDDTYVNIEPGTHFCHFYRDEEERRGVVSSFINGGISRSERTGYLYDINDEEKTLQWFEKNIQNFKENIEKGNLFVGCADEAYCQDNTFVPERMLELIGVVCETALEEGFSGVRVAADMSWVLKDIMGADRIIEYEGLVNSVFSRYPLSSICQYDMNRFDGKTLYQIMSVHPWIILNGNIIRNKTYSNTDELLYFLSGNYQYS